MSIDFNTVINSAIQEAAKRRITAGQTANKISDPNSMDKSGRDSELSMGDLATAIKSKNAQKSQDSKFVTTNGKTFKDTREDENCSGVVADVQTKISAIQESSEHSYSRQAEISHSLKSYQKDPYCK